MLRELGFAAAAVACYLAVGLYTRESTTEAVDHARDVVHLERVLGIAWEHGVQEATLAVPGLGTVLTQFYVWGYFPTLVALVAWLFVRDRATYRSLRNALLVSGTVGLAVYASYPCAPPWIGGSGFTDTVTSSSVEAVARPAGITNHLGALPSFHVGWVVLVAVLLGQVARSRILRVLLVLYPGLMAYAVVATGNHWVLDVPAGVLLALVGLVGARLVHVDRPQGGGRHRSGEPGCPKRTRSSSPSATGRSRSEDSAPGAARGPKGPRFASFGPARDGQRAPTVVSWKPT